MAEALTALSEKTKYSQLQTYFPDTGKYSRAKYPIQVRLMKKGKDRRFRAFIGANRSGKSVWLGCEVSYHALGLYPTWWEGKVFKKPRQIWLVAESGKLWRESLQRLLFGEAGEEVGTGLIPLAEKNNGIGIISYSGLEGCAGAIGSAIIKHKNGHTVSLVIKTNEMSREQFQAAKVDVLAFDEEPRKEIWDEAMMRLMATGTKEPGIAMFAFTPMKGSSEVVLDFVPDGIFPKDGEIDDSITGNYVCGVSWDKAPHLSEDEKTQMLMKIAPNQRATRTEGTIALGSGKIFPVEEEFIVVPQFKIPEHWPRAYGLDFGYHNTAAVWVARDPDTKTKYVYAEYKRGQIHDMIHVQAIQAKGKWIPGICDPRSGHRDGGELRADYYRSLGLDLTDGESNPSAGIAMILNDLESGQLKILSNCPGLIKELRTYRYDTRNPTRPAQKQDDHEIDALRYYYSQCEWVSKSLEEVFYPKKDLRIRRDSGRSTLTGY